MPLLRQFARSWRRPHFFCASRGRRSAPQGPPIDVLCRQPATLLRHAVFLQLNGQFHHGRVIKLR